MVARGRDLLIGVGNPTRRDDRAGHVVVASAAALLPGATVLSVQQLDIAHVEAVASHDRVVFADASVEQGPPTSLRRLAERWEGMPHGHALSPGSVLHLATQITGRRVEGWLATVRGNDFSFGETMTPACAREAARIAERVVKLLASPG